MTIYRIHHDDHYLVFEIPTAEVVKKLGREYPFHIKHAPVSYTSVWAEPLNITFKAAERETQAIIPDIAARNGRLFMNEKAYSALKDLLSVSGEFLPVTYDQTQGFRSFSITRGKVL